MAQLRKKNAILFSLTLSACIAIIALLFLTESTHKAPDVKPQVYPVKAIEIKKGTYQPNVILYGKTDSPYHSTVEATIQADVSETPVLEGKKVKKGDVLVILDDQEAQINYDQAKAQVNQYVAELAIEKQQYERDVKKHQHEQELYTLNEAALQRQATLLKKGYASQSDIDRAKITLKEEAIRLENISFDIQKHQSNAERLSALLDGAKATFAQAALDLSRTTIKAPFDGIVTTLHVSVGDRVMPGEPVITLYNPDILEIESEIPDAYIGTVNQAMKEHQTLNAHTFYQNQRVSLTLARVAQKVESGHSGLLGYFTVTNDETLLPIGLTLKVNLQLPEISEAYRVPTSSLFSNNVVYLIKNKTLAPITVTLHGEEHSAKEKIYAIIKSDQLKTGDMILVTHLPNAIMGLPVSIIKDEPST